MGTHVGAVRPKRMLQAGACGLAAVGLLAGGLVAGSAVGPGVPDAQAATVAGNVGFGEMLKTPGTGTVFVGPLAASAADAKALGVPASSLFWCDDWSVSNERSVTSKKRSTTSTAAAATANYVIQANQSDKDKHSRIAIAVHQLMDQGRAKTSKGQWGYEAKEGPHRHIGRGLRRA